MFQGTRAFTFEQYEARCVAQRKCLISKIGRFGVLDARRTTSIILLNPVRFSPLRVRPRGRREGSERATQPRK